MRSGRAALRFLAADRLVDQDHLVDAVVVPLVVGRHIDGPTSPCRCRRRARRSSSTSLFVARPLHRDSRCWGVSGAVIDQVEVRIIRHASPRWCLRRSSTDRLPGLQRKSPLRTGLPRGGGLGRVDQHVLVGTRRVRPPRQLAVLDVVGGDVGRARRTRRPSCRSGPRCCLWVPRDSF